MLNPLCSVVSLLLVILAPTALGDVLTEHGMLANIDVLMQSKVLLASIANVSDVAVGSNGEGVSKYSVSSSGKVSALFTLNGLRRSVQATRMNYVCWEGKVAQYADYVSNQCKQSATLPANYDGTTYPSNTGYSYTYISTTEISVAAALQIAFNEGSGSTYYNMLMKYDLSYMACGQNRCSRYLLNSGNYYANAYTTSCLFYYTSPINFVPPFTVGPVCSACPSSRTCDEGLCRDNSAFKPQLQCNGSPGTMTAISVQSVTVVMVLTKWFQSL